MSVSLNAADVMFDGERFLITRLSKKFPRSWVHFRFYVFTVAPNAVWCLTVLSGQQYNNNDKFNSTALDISWGSKIVNLFLTIL